MTTPGFAIPVVTSPLHRGHSPRVEVACGRPMPAFDVVARMQSVLDALTPDSHFELTPPRQDLTVAAQIERVHDVKLVEFLRRAWDEIESPDDGVDLIFADTFSHTGFHAPTKPTKSVTDAAAMGLYCFDTITGIGPNTYAAAIGSVVTALTAAERTVGGSDLTLALCRPPGHHVTVDAFGGGCYLNNAAISAQWLRDHGADRVAVVDLDFHHGNGTQAIFYDRADVLYTSLHGHPDRSYPYFTGYADETGTGQGLGANLNLPFEAGVDGRIYGGLVERALSAVEEHRPDFVVVSLGFDTYCDDPAGDAALQTDDYRDVGKLFSELDVPVLALLEGGYSVPQLGANVRAWSTGAAGLGE